MGFSRQEYQSGLPFPPPRDLPDPGIKPTSPISPALQSDALPRRHHYTELYFLMLSHLCFSICSFLHPFHFCPPTCPSFIIFSLLYSFRLVSVISRAEIIYSLISNRVVLLNRYLLIKTEIQFQI